MNEDVIAKWVTENRYEILSLVEPGGWQAVFYTLDGDSAVLWATSLDFMAVVENTVRAMRHTADDDDPKCERELVVRIVAGVKLYDCGFMVVEELENFAGYHRGGGAPEPEKMHKLGRDVLQLVVRTIESANAKKEGVSQ